MSNENPKKIQKIRLFWEKYEKKILLTLGLVLIAIISFEIGLLKGQKLEQKTLVIEKPMETKTGPSESKNKGVLGVLDSSLKADNAKKEETPVDNKNCLFLGSKNSNKYHKPDCRWAKNIKPENVVCFNSEEDARNKGYEGDKNCIK